MIIFNQTARKSLRLGVIIVTAALGLSACSEGMGDLEQKVAEIKARKSAKIDPIPQIKPYEAVQYIAGDRRDPFVPATPDRDRAPVSSSAVPGPDRNRNREPLEEFPVDSLRMVGTIEYNGRMYALVKAPDLVIHRVTTGDHMGQNYGRITTISATEIDLIELIPDGFGGWTERPASLALEE